MRTRIAAVLVVAAVALVHAGDAKLTEFIRLYDKELTACKKDLAGLVKVKDRGTPLAADASVAADLAIIDASLKVQETYCTDVAAALDVARADPKATYKSLGKQLDDKDRIVRADRKASKKALADTEPVIKRLVPRINAMAGSAAPTPAKKTPGTFPSGRTVDLPALAGTWSVSGSATTDIAEYAEANVTSTVTVKAFTGATCDQQKKQLAGKFTLEDRTIESLAAEKPAFVAGYRTGKASAERVVVVACIAKKDGGVLATSDTPAAQSLATTTAIQGVMVAMIAAF
ncbi:MAG: hypothetical protein HOV81_11465 [Kofleriaceae bacterium]|nr:hypothetical protein [Kofleriaceae bacterium]